VHRNVCQSRILHGRMCGIGSGIADRLKAFDAIRV
jgi:hypothetical protein